jgi:hypothetical protein
MDYMVASCRKVLPQHQHAYKSLRDELIQKGTWTNHWLYDKMQSFVAQALGIVPEHTVYIKKVRARRSRLKLRSRTLPYLGGITGRMRQR